MPPVEASGSSGVRSRFTPIEGVTGLSELVVGEAKRGRLLNLPKLAWMAVFLETQAARIDSESPGAFGRLFGARLVPDRAAARHFTLLQ